MKYIILLIGSGGREHAIAKALFRTKDNEDKIDLYCFASHNNPQLRRLSQQMIIGKSIDDLEVFIDIIGSIYDSKFKFPFSDDYVIYSIIGPENPIAEGYTEFLQSKGIQCVAPTKDYAQIETSKIFARQLLDKYDLKQYNPKYVINPGFENNELNMMELNECLKEFNNNYVVKNNGLAGGKGVKLTDEHLKNSGDTIRFVNEITSKGNSFIIEEKLNGKEFSVISLTDGENLLHCPAVQDYKRAFYGDTGPNTGGMGSITNLDFLEDREYEEACTVNETVVRALKKELGGERGYKGILYGSFMKTNEVEPKIKVIEYNCRFGDPECLNIMSLIDCNLSKVFWSILDNSVHLFKQDLFNFTNLYTVCKYLVPEGYPNNPLKNFDIYFSDACPNEIKKRFIFASVEESNGHLYQIGSRALAYVGMGLTREQAYNDVTKAFEYIQGKLFFREDIGNTIKSKYELAGVNIEEGNEVVRKIGDLQNEDTNNIVYNRLKKIREDDHNSFNGIVNIGRILDYYHENINDNYNMIGGAIARTNNDSPCKVNTINNYKLVVSSDGVGTKSILSKRWFGLKGVKMLGHDLVNHCVDDILVSGSHPIMFQDYFASSKIDSNEVSAFVEGVLEACKNNNCLLTGGETAEMPDVYQPNMIDVVGTIVGVRDDAFAFHPKDDIKEGDVIVAVPSVSPHTNGYSLIRKIVERVGEENLSTEMKMKLVTPHKSYLNDIAQIQRNSSLFNNLHGICHITGGGFIDNPPRVLKPELKTELDIDLIFSKLPDYFAWIMENGKLSRDEMLHVFNCGIGLLLFIEKGAENEILSLIENSYVVGSVVLK